MRVINVVGTRPNFMKLAPLMAEFERRDGFEPLLVHTGQHYDEQMSEVFFRQLGLRRPDMDLGVGSGSHAQQTARIMARFEPVVLEADPDAVLVVGDVNSTVACGLVAVKLGVPLVHVEAGLRSFDRSMPEEINRIVTDAISDLLFVSEPAGYHNLIREGASPAKLFLVGNVMIDTVLQNQERAEASTILADLGLQPSEYAVLTLHRPANVDDAATFGRILQALEAIQRDIPVVFPVHPRTREALARSALGQRVAAMANLRVLAPLGYLDFLKLMGHAKCVLTDSGGIQEETTILNVPCLTLRDNTERPITVAVGSNRLVGSDPQAIVAAWRDVAAGRWRPAGLPALWDGHAAERIVDVLAHGPRATARAANEALVAAAT